MNQEKYIGMDVHDATISAAVKNAEGKLLMECVLETKASTILDFIQGLRGTLALTFEEGILAAWLHDLLKPHVSRLVVCDPRKNALMRDGNQNDRADARNLAELLRTNQVKAVYHGKHGTRALKELGRSYLTLTKDSTRVMNRIKSVYRSWAIPCGGTSVYSRRHRAEWLAKLVEPAVRIRAEHLYQQLDSLEPVRQAARRQLLGESRKHAAVKLLRQIPAIGPIRSALLVAILQTPHRFRTKRQLWAYSGFAVRTYDSGEYRMCAGNGNATVATSTTFSSDECSRGCNKYASYQLIRNVLAAHALGLSFCVILDARRPDLIEAWYAIMRCVRDSELRTLCQVLTWQELSEVLPREVRQFLNEKYGIGTLETIAKPTDTFFSLAH